jgi:hypothetical protein
LPFHQKRLRRSLPTKTMPTAIASNIGRALSVRPPALSTVLKPSVRQKSAKVT